MLPEDVLDWIEREKERGVREGDILNFLYKKGYDVSDIAAALWGKRVEDAGFNRKRKFLWIVLIFLQWLVF